MDPATLATQAAGFLAPYLVKAGQKAAEKVGEKLPEAAGAVWKAITGRFKGKEAAEEAVQDLVAKPEDQLNQSAFAKQLRKILEADPAFATELERMLKSPAVEVGDTIIQTGSGAVATRGGVAAGEGGVAVKGDVHGGISMDKRSKE